VTNVKHEIKGDKLLITVDVSKRTVEKAAPSKSGKTRIVGSTNGFVTLDGGLQLAVNVVAK